MTDEPAEEVLLSAIQAGDRAAFARAVAVHERAVRRFAAAFLGDATEGDDVAQRVFLDLWNDRNVLRPDGSLRGLLLARARHLCLNRSRARARAGVRAVRFSTELGDAPPTPLDVLLAVEEARDAGALYERIQAHVADLGDDARACVWMRFAAGASFDTMAEALGRPPHAVRAFLYRQLALLRGRLRRDAP